MKWISIRKYPFENLKGDRKHYKENYKLFINAFNFDEWTYYEQVRDLRKFLSNDRNYNDCQLDASNVSIGNMHWIDHARFFRNKSLGRTWLVSQPYGYELKEIKTFVEELNLVVYPLDQKCGFYYAKGTIPIIVMTVEDSKNFFIGHDNLKKRLMIGV
ncbi:hypothetical protein [Enterococcus sp. AZ109]|uniref:hypothetical protein n=1 Tax=Enterococcus sp. AZ109 TaxID=2774634 RepID=UPI003F2602F1